jgi:hypothetical protein
MLRQDATQSGAELPVGANLGLGRHLQHPAVAEIDEGTLAARTQGIRGIGRLHCRSGSHPDAVDILTQALGCGIVRLRCGCERVGEVIRNGVSWNG